MLCDALGRWAQRRRAQVQVVFDGPSPRPDLARQIGHSAIQVSYSGAGHTADAVIEDTLANHSAARRLMVVSSDRAVLRAAKRRRARAVRSDEFWDRVKRDLARPEPERMEPEEKETGLDSEATQTWLEEFGFDEPSGGRW